MPRTQLRVATANGIAGSETAHGPATETTRLRVSSRLAQLARRELATLALPLMAAALHGQGEPIELEPVVVAANRLESSSATLSSRVDLPATLQGPRALASSLSEKLETYPGYAAFRSTSAAVAHPTTQGVRLRNLGANATSRALVIHDGVPQNDPFGGWIYWHQFNPATLESLEIVPTGGGEIWGNQGSGGVVSLASTSHRPPAATVGLSLGSFDTLELNAATTQGLGKTVDLDLGLRYFDTAGFHTLEASQRGAIDERSFSEAASLLGQLRWRPAEDWRVQLAARGFEEERGNGTPLARNETEALNLSLLAERLLDRQGSRLNLVAYRQDWDFKNVFTSVNEDRSAESPALDQFDVPAESAGLALSYKRILGDDDYLLVGLDARQVKGAVNERYRNLSSGFTRQRYAGGEQRFYGVFGSYQRAASAADTLSATLRVERIENGEGRRIETDTENDEVLSDDRYSDRRDEEISANIRWRRAFGAQTAGYATLFTGFRAPTLNELYRPYRVRNDIFEANPQLANEKQAGIELAVETGEGQDWSGRAALFHYRLDHTVANALVTTDPGFHPLFGFIPEGGSGSARANIDRSRVRGLELQGGYAFSSALRLDASLVYADSEVRREEEFAAFVGHEFPQAPPLRLNVGMQWSLSDKWLAWGRLAWRDQSYENLPNDALLPDATRVDFGLSYAVAQDHTLALIVDNLFDERVVAGVSNEGLITIDAPRSARLLWTWRH